MPEHHYSEQIMYMFFIASADSVILHSLHGSSPQTGITIYFMDGRKGDILDYLCEDNKWCFQLGFPCQNYGMITECVRFLIRSGQESHMIT